MKRSIGWLFLGSLALTICASNAWAVSPNALQNAYWRFEEGPAGNGVPPGTEFVQDSNSGTDNDMRASSANTSPTYTATVAPFPLRSGAANNLAFDFTANPTGGGDDLFTNDRMIDNGTIATGGGYTLEAAFRPDVVGGPFQAIVAKNGLPNGPLPTLVLKVRGDNGNLQIEQFDKSNVLKDVQSTAALSPGQWYAAAAVNDGTSMSLYLRGQSDPDYVLQGSVAVNGALYQGTADDWDKPWSIGRAVFGGSGDGTPNDWFDGIIDEVRLTNRALSTSEFLFQPVPEPQTIALVVIGIAGWVAARRRGH